MIKVTNKDSIIDVIKKIESSQDNEIILEFPIGNTILHNYTSLKLLKNKAGTKNLIIITNDINAKKIGRRLGIKYSILNDKNSLKNIDLLEYNYTFGEYLIFLLKSYYKEFKNLFSSKNDNTLFGYYKNKTKEKSMMGFFIVGLIASALLLIFIFYFAVNKTYITITPEITIRNRAKNFIFKENVPDESIVNDNIIKLTPISKIIYLEEIFGTHGIKDSNSGKSKGTVSLYNNLAEEIPLLNNTRLETNDGIVYTIEGRVTIPKAIKQEDGKIVAGTINANIVAKSFDNKGLFTGEKANIGTGITLTFPGLKDLSRDVYAKTITVFTGGNNNYTKIVASDDIENAKKLFEEKLKTTALKELKKQIEEDNQKNNIRYEILGIDKIINYSNIEIKGAENVKVGEEKENFKLSGTLQINTYIFNKELVINKLKTIIRDLLLEDVEKINYIDENSLRLSNIIYQNNKPFEAKITTEIEVQYSINFLSTTNNYLNKLKDKIAGINKDEAIKILLNNTKISDVKIETRPFFIKNISNINKNIIFEVKEN